MKGLIRRIIDLGIDSGSQSYKVSAVRISNIIALIFFAAGVIYGVISAYLAPQLINVCLILALGSLLVLALNFLQMSDVSRFVLTLLISLDVAIYHAYIVHEGESIIVSIYIGQLVVAVLPWIFIDIRERLLLTASLIISFGIFIAQPWTNQMLEIDMDSSVFRENSFAIPTYAFSVFTLIFSMFLLQNKNLQSEKRSEQLLKEISDRAKEMEAQQEQLLQTLEENKLVAQAEEKRNWIAKGLSQIGNLMRGEMNDQFYQTLVSETVAFMHINQAGIYIVDVEGDEKIIDLRAAYAFDRNKFLKKKIEIGQGLVGQCYLEKERIFLKKVPEDYLHITSGLGDAPPRCILIVPLIHSNNVEGILELASFNELNEFEIEFAEKLAEALASFVAGNRINLRTKMLLEQFQMQSEELRAQEEEMRQNLEEMQATQEEIHRKEQEYLQRIAELERELGIHQEDKY